MRAWSTRSRFDSGGEASVGAVDSLGDAHSERRSRRTKRLIRARGVGLAESCTAQRESASSREGTRDRKYNRGATQAKPTGGTWAGKRERRLGLPRVLNYQRGTFVFCVWSRGAGFWAAERQEICVEGIKAKSYFRSEFYNMCDPRFARKKWSDF